VDSSKLNDWLQVVGLFGVIGSLLFVGLQMQQDREVAILAAYQARSDLTAETIVSLMDNDEYRAAEIRFRSGGGNLDSLSPEDYQLIMMRAAAQMYMTENVFFQYESGFLPEDHWQKSRRILKDSLRNEPMRRTYEERPEGWRPSFGAIVEQLIAELDMEEKKDP
jgi:hypothetical protein